MLESIKRALAPFVLSRVAAACRSPQKAAASKDRLWSIAQNYATYFDIKTDATIANGMKMAVSSGPRVEQEIFIFGEWEPLFTRYLRSIPQNEDIFLDIGANIGYFSLLASDIFAQVHAIEASPSTSLRFLENLSRNKTQNIELHQTAVGAESGYTDFYQDTSQSGAASAIKREDGVFEARVPIAPLPDILKDIEWERVRFIKVDVEGHEAPVLQSIFEMQAALHPAVEIFVEFIPTDKEVWALIKTFIAQGFSAHLLHGNYNREDYVDGTRMSDLAPVVAPPEIVCDILLRRR